MAAQAQPFMRPEVVWRTTSVDATYAPAPQAARIEPDGDGFVVAWSEVDDDGVSRAYAGRLDGNGKLVAVGVNSSGTADAPTVVPFAGRYVAAWLEPEGVDARPVLVTAALDRAFHVVSTRPVGLTAGPPIARAEVGRAYIASGSVLYEVDADAAPITVYDVPSMIDDVAAADDQIGYVYRGKLPLSSLGFTWLFRSTNGRLIFPLTLAAVGSNGSEFLVVWSEGTPSRLQASLFGASFKPFQISVHGLTVTDKLAQPQVAWDGAEWVVVWPAGESIEGAVVTPDRVVTTFHIADQGRRPAVASARRGRFVVTYEVYELTERRLVSRAIDFPPLPRERVVR